MSPCKGGRESPRDPPWEQLVFRAGEDMVPWLDTLVGEAQMSLWQVTHNDYKGINLAQSFKRGSFDVQL